MGNPADIYLGTDMHRSCWLPSVIQSLRIIPVNDETWVEYPIGQVQIEFKSEVTNVTFVEGKIAMPQALCGSIENTLELATQQINRERKFAAVRVGTKLDINPCFFTGLKAERFSISIADGDFRDSDRHIVINHVHTL